MTLYLSDVLNVDKLQKEIYNDFVRFQDHPTLPLRIYCYTHKAQFKRNWSHEVRTCRGLIVNLEDNSIVATGPSKFFNYGQVEAPAIDLGMVCTVTDKLDGSLGIYWRYKEFDGIATKGSFESPQAMKATEMLNSSDVGKNLRLDWDFEVLSSFTPVFEIIYPEGRIVLNYGTEESLRSLGAVRISDGIIDRNSATDAVVLHEMITVAKALSLPPRSNTEGLVLDVYPSFGTTHHIKIKYPDYVRLHGIVTNTSARNIWVYLVAEKFDHFIENPKHWGSLFFWDVEDFEDARKQKDWRDNLFDTVPDEFEEWVHTTIADLEAQAQVFIEDAYDFAETIRGIEDRAEQYQASRSHVMSTEIMRYLNHGNSTGIEVKAWSLAQPMGNTGPWVSDSED